MRGRRYNSTCSLIYDLDTDGAGLEVKKVKLKALLISFQLQASSDVYATVSPQLPTALYQTLQKHTVNNRK